MKKPSKRIEDFPHKADPNSNPLFIVYPSVTFSELKTFELMRLLNSFRRWNGDLFDESPMIGTMEHVDSFLEKYSHHYETPEQVEKARKYLFSVFDWKPIIDSRRKRLKYLTALKKELATREHLTPHEKRSAAKCSY